LYLCFVYPKGLRTIPPSLSETSFLPGTSLDDARHSGFMGSKHPYHLTNMVCYVISAQEILLCGFKLREKEIGECLEYL
jgi:hypothetical protein